MRIAVVVISVLGIVLGQESIYTRENEPDPREYVPFKMPAMIRHVCESLRWFLEEQRENRPSNALQLSQLFVLEFDSDGNGCIAGNEIRDIAARFRGNLAGYRTIFTHVLDENRSGCVESDELNSLVLDCIMPSRGVPESGIFSSPREREEMARILQKHEPVEDVVLGEKREPEENFDTLEMSQDERDDIDRRAMLEESQFNSAETALNPAVKEMICSTIRREHEDAEFGLRTLAQIVDTDGVEGLSFEEVFEFLSASRVPREETDDLARIMDNNSDGVVTVEELMSAVDNCPVPYIQPAPIVNTRPRVNFQGKCVPDIQPAPIVNTRTRVNFQGKCVPDIQPAPIVNTRTRVNFQGKCVPDIQLAPIVNTRPRVNFQGKCVPDIQPAPIVNTRPRVNFQDVECPSPEAVYKELRVRAMKFLGTREVQFEEAKEAATQLYALITGDVEEVIEPKDLDVPVDCVKEVWQDIDSDRNGFLDLIEFNRIALDIFEEFLPKPVKKLKSYEDARAEEEAAVPAVNPYLAEVPRVELDTLAQIIYKIASEGGVRIPESDMERVIELLLQDAGVAALMDKVQSLGRFTAEAENTLASLIRPTLYQLLSE
ncbi:hypothetical protein ACHWQZ_G001130 [Mnemiopsis leidyi]